MVQKFACLGKVVWNADGFAIRKFGEMPCGYDAALWKFRSFCAATPQRHFAKVMHRNALMQTWAFFDCGVARAEIKRQIQSAGVVATSESAQFRVSRKRPAFQNKE